MSLVDQKRPARPTVAVLFGGRSTEHEVSCLSAQEVLAVIDSSKFDVRPIGITRGGDWVEETGVWSDGETPTVRAGNTKVAWESVCRADVVFPLLHGPWGEDGTIQGLLEMAGVRFVGSGVLASALSMDKHHSKLLFSGLNLPQVRHITVMPGQWKSEPEIIESKVAELGFPVFVKPSRAGSSVGVHRVDKLAKLSAAVTGASFNDPKVIIEAGVVNGREFECGVIQTMDGETIASVVGEIVIAPNSERGFYDFDSKYVDEANADIVVPADISMELSEQIRGYARQVFDSIGCEGLARVDFFLDDEAGLVVNEINTMPGFTPFSMFPKLWASTGISPQELVSELIELALARTAGLR